MFDSGVKRDVVDTNNYFIIFYKALQMLKARIENPLHYHPNTLKFLKWVLICTTA